MENHDGMISAGKYSDFPPELSGNANSRSI
jgi:hypothetical protein